jgi:hypothetical protein
MPNLPAPSGCSGRTRKETKQQTIRNNAFLVNEIKVKRQKEIPERCARSESPIVTALEVQLGNA